MVRFPKPKRQALCLTLGSVMVGGVVLGGCRSVAGATTWPTEPCAFAEWRINMFKRQIGDGERWRMRQRNSQQPVADKILDDLDERSPRGPMEFTSTSAAIQSASSHRT